MIHNRFNLRAIGVALGLLAAVAPVAPDVSPERHRSMIEWAKRKSKPRKSGGGRRPGERGLRGPVWKWLHDKGHIVSMGARAHCGKHKKRYKQLRYRFTLEDETTGVRRSIKAKTYGCPICIRAA